jgi:signal transduction histidine kinase
MKRYGSLRWILLTAGVIAILGITGMNVYSLYALHENTIEYDRENKKLQISEFADKIRYRFFKKFYGLGSTGIKRLETHFQETGQFTNDVTSLLDKAATDSMYSGIYFVPSGSDVCQQQSAILKYRADDNRFNRSDSYSKVVCDGMGIARTQMKSLISDYRYNNKVIFDSHRSLTIVFVDPSEQSIFGYLIMPFNQDYLRNSFLPKKLAEKFGTPDQSGMNVWLRDWTNNEIIASSDSTLTYNREKIQFEQNFPDFFDYWKIEVSFTDASTVAASNSSLLKNLLVLGAAMILLLGALVFMFISAQKERALAERQADFLANVTHELKTPLSVMQAAGENLADGRVKDQDRLKSYGSHIYSEAVRLRKMIEKLLDVAKANAGQSLIEPKPVDIRQRLLSYLDEHRNYIQNKGFTVDTSITSDEAIVMMDPNSFDTILSNLVENAVKYSNEEKYLSVSLQQNHSSKEIELRVEDHGIGMSKKNMSNIFDKFFRAEDTLTAKTKGHGLGLSIVKNLVELNGGSISVESEPSEGSTFIVTFPILEDVPEQKVSTAQNESQQNGSESLKEESKTYVS